MHEIILLSVAFFAVMVFWIELRKFNYTKILPAIAFPILLFAFGFTLRLAQDKELIDLGFFFTEFSFLFTYLLFTVALLLGQVKYWGIK
jgi:hypothetical protein